MYAPAPVVHTLRRLGGWLAPYRFRLAAAAGLTVLVCLLNLPVPLLVRALIDRASDASLPDLAEYAGWLLAVVAAQGLAAYANAVAAGRLGLDVVRDLRLRLYAHLHRLPVAEHDRTPAGVFLARVTVDVVAVHNLVGTQTLTAVTDLGTLLVAAGWFLTRSPRLFIFAAAFVPVYLVLFRCYAVPIRRGSADVRDQLDRIFGRLKEKLDGVLVVQAHARGPAEVAAFARQIDDAHAPRLRVGRLTAAFSQFGQAAGGIGTAVVFTAAAYELLNGRLTAGEVGSAAALAALLFGPVARLAELASTLQQATASVSRLGALLDTPATRSAGTPPPPPAAPLPLGRPRGRVVFDRVGFAYRPGEPVIRDLSVQIEAGMKVAVVGPTGCGKSTLLNLLLHFYGPTAGEIRIDGVPLRRINPAELRRQVAVVPQDAVVFRASLADNIRYGCPGADLARVRAAAAAVGVDEFAARLPHGYDTVLGGGDVSLSQGQRQRVAIARALCADPAVVLLDEATSALDPASEAAVQAALDNLLRGRTAVVVAHRLTTVRNADRIIVLDGGRAVQVGTHAELIADGGGPYAELWARQEGGEVVAPLPAVPRQAWERGM